MQQPEGYFHPSHTPLNEFLRFTAAQAGISKRVGSFQDPVPFPTLCSSDGSSREAETQICFLAKDFSFPPPTAGARRGRGRRARSAGQPPLVGNLLRMALLSRVCGRALLLGDGAVYWLGILLVHLFLL